MEAIISFRDEYAFLSNFWICKINWERLVYPSAEHAYQASKTPVLADRVQFTDSSISPKTAKRMGARLMLRPNWELIKVWVMEQLIARKFEPGSDLAIRLLKTHPAELVEGNTWGDVYWGVCNGRGHNLLGLILMDFREKLKCYCSIKQ